ncbi:FUSC family protein [Streptomyces sp. NPDC004069]
MTTLVARRLPHTLRAPRPRQAVDVSVRVGKALIAALLAWEIASWCIPGRQQYLAVATALLMVNAPTVYRSVTQAVRSLATRVAGLSLAVAVVWLFGSTAGSMVAVLAIALVAGGRRSSDNRLQVVSTAVLALTAATAAPVGQTAVLALEALVGAAVGIAVNALVLPPLHLDASHASVRGLATAVGSLLDDMGRGLREREHADRAHAWLERGRRLEDVHRGEESLRWNTRCAAVHGGRESAHCEVLRALHRISFQVRGIARTLADNVDDRHTDHRLGRLFVDRYAATLKAAGRAVESFAVPGQATDFGGAKTRERLREAIGEATAWHETMTGLIERGALAEPGAWHVYGSLMTDIERLLAELDHADRSTAPAGARQGTGIAGVFPDGEGSQESYSSSTRAKPSAIQASSVRARAMRPS